MTDKELLELAAKAVGIEHCANVFGMFFLEQEDRYWNPLTDDGDALRLAITLKLNIESYIGEVVVADAACKLSVEKYENALNYNDSYAATRRAIVRAAAEIGKEMK